MSDVLKGYLWVALGSALGGVARHWVSAVLAARLGKGFPWHTVFVNVSGSFVIGCLAALISVEGKVAVPLRPVVLQFLMVGICGGYTTFSSFSLQTLNLLQEGAWLSAAANVVASVLVCLFAVWAGFSIGQILNR